MKKPVQHLVPLQEGARSAKSATRADASPPLLTMVVASQQLGIGMQTLKTWIADGTIYAIPVGASGRHWKIPVAEIEKFRSGRYGGDRVRGTVHN